MGLFRKKLLPEKAETSQHHEGFESFLTNEYLGSKYIVPVHIDAALRSAVEMLSTQAGFYGLVNVGGTANGSYEWRSRTNSHPASDLDFYFIGDSSLDLSVASNHVRERMAVIGLHVDGELNGMNPENYLNTDELDLIIDRGDAALLALPFQSCYGKDVALMRNRIIDAVLARPDAQEVWDVIANFHAQSLSLHHGTFTDQQNELIMNTYYPLKIEKFDLPVGPEGAYAEATLGNSQEF